MNARPINETGDYEDPMEEIYAIRRKISERCGHSIDRLFELLADRQIKDEANGIHYVNLPIVRRTPSVVQST